ncbi:MAG: hypothetical protein KDB03_13920 [Planctomycetales bacterium]|nr:hypothetical protein [Planctomycetales bacterium]
MYPSNRCSSSFEYSGRYTLIVMFFVLPMNVGADETDSSESSSVVSYSKQVAPILTKNCVACHSSLKAESGLNLENYEALRKGGDSGEVIATGDPEASLLLQRIMDPDEPMPPADNAVGAVALVPEEIELLKRWIQEGAAAPTDKGMYQALHWQPLPESLQPAYAMAASPDGNFLAFGHGNTVRLREFARERNSHAVQTLIDENLRYEDRPASTTHLDIVQSIAFSPEGQLLATGGYRSVKIWQRATTPQLALKGLPNSVQISAVSADDSVWVLNTGDHVLEIVHPQAGYSQRLLALHSEPIKGMAFLGASLNLMTLDSSGRSVIVNVDTLKHRNVQIECDGSLAEIVPIRTPERQENWWVGGRTTDGKSAVIEVPVNLDFSSSAVLPVPARPVGIEQAIGQLLPLEVLDRRIGLVAETGSLYIVDAQSGEKKADLKLTDKPLRLAASKDGDHIAVMLEEGKVQLWSLESASLVATLDQDYVVTQQAQLVRRDAGRQKALIDLLTSQVPELQKEADKEAEAVKKVTEARDKASTVVTDRQKEIDSAQASVTTAEQTLAAAQQALQEAMQKVESLKSELETKQKSVAEQLEKKKQAEVELANREQALATANESRARAESAVPDMQAKIEAENQRLAELEKQAIDLEASSKLARPVSMVFDPDGDRLSVADAEGRLNIFSALTGRSIGKLQTAEKIAYLISSAGNLWGISAQGALWRWDWQMPWKLQHAIGNATDSPFSDRITALDFSPDGKLLAVGSGPPSRFGELKILQVETGEVTTSLDIHTDSVLAVRFSPDGRYLASGSADKLCN